VRLCSTGHGNPDDAEFCQVCGLALGIEPNAFPPQPSLVPSIAPAGEAPPPAVSGGRRTALLVGVGVGALLILFLISIAFVQLSQPRLQDLTVNLELNSGLDSCSVGIGYLDVPGSSILIETDDGSLHRGRLGSQGRDQGLSCLFTGVVYDVPADSNQYLVTLGGGRRGELMYSLSELEAQDWTVVLTLGSR
jgi:hypothetical protein